MASSSSNNNNTSWKKHGIVGVLNGLGGLNDFSFFRGPSWVKMENPPGCTPLPKSQSIIDIIQRYGSLSFFFYSPNIVWFFMAIVMWNIYPYYDYYDTTTTTTTTMTTGTTALVWKWDPDHPYKSCLYRIGFNYCIFMMYYIFWHVQIPRVCERPFLSLHKTTTTTTDSHNDNENYNWNKTIHNVWYSTLGSIQWSLIECGFIYGYATGRLSYVTTQELWSTVTTTPHWFLYYGMIWSLAVIVIRDIHFYFAHRLIHLRCLYKYIHSLHHRNSDIEPFAGMSMHPIEHFYYFTCYGPLLLFSSLHPFMVLWMGVHVTITPGCGHSGWEDHWQADLMHYLHHVYYEVNYGTGSIPMDHWFGTYKDQLELSYATKYNNNNNNKNHPKKNYNNDHPHVNATTTAAATVLVDPKANLFHGSIEYPLYWIGGVLVPIVLLWIALTTNSDQKPMTILTSIGIIMNNHPTIVAAMLSLFPILVAIVLHSFSKIPSSSSYSTGHQGPTMEDYIRHYLGPVSSSSSSKTNNNIAPPPTTATTPITQQRKENYVFIIISGMICTWYPAFLFLQMILSSLEI